MCTDRTPTNFAWVCKNPAVTDLGGVVLLYVNLARTGYMRNTQYHWSHMINNVASSIFGIIFISLWTAVSPEVSTSTPYTRATMTAFVVLAQVFAYVSAFLPAGLGIHTVIRNGDIALQMSKPVPFFPLVIARETGNIAYQVLFRAIPIAVVLGLAVGFPPPASVGHLILTVPSLLIGGYIGLTIVYTVGMSSLWTLEVKWAHWLYWSVITLLSGG